jgi:hypothetical protein
MIGFRREGYVRGLEKGMIANEERKFGNALLNLLTCALL